MSDEEPIQIIVGAVELRIGFRAVQGGEEIPYVTPDGRRLDGWPVAIPLGKAAGIPLSEEVLGPFLHAQLRAWRDTTLRRVEQMLGERPVPRNGNGEAEEAAGRETAAAAGEK